MGTTIKALFLTTQRHKTPGPRERLTPGALDLPSGSRGIRGPPGGTPPAASDAALFISVARGLHVDDIWLTMGYYGLLWVTMGYYGSYGFTMGLGYYGSYGFTMGY